MPTATKKQRHQWRVGDEAWHVEWCSKIPVDEFGDLDLDRATEHCVTFTTRDAAMLYAMQVYPRDQFGSVRITPVRFDPYDEDDAIAYPHVGFWEATGDSEHYEGE